MKKVESIEQLRELVRNDVQNYVILLAGGLARSSKFIYEGEDGELWVVNLIDDSECRLSDTNIYEAIKKGAFYAEEE